VPLRETATMKTLVLCPTAAKVFPAFIFGSPNNPSPPEERHERGARSASEEERGGGGRSNVAPQGMNASRSRAGARLQTTGECECPVAPFPPQRQRTQAPRWAATRRARRNIPGAPLCCFPLRLSAVPKLRSRAYTGLQDRKDS